MKVKKQKYVVEPAGDMMKNALGKRLLIVLAVVILCGVLFPLPANTALACDTGKTPQYWEERVGEWNTTGTENQDLTGTFYSIFGVGPEISLLSVLRYDGAKGIQPVFYNFVCTISSNCGYWNLIELWRTWGATMYEQCLQSEITCYKFFKQAVASLLNSTCESINDYWNTWDVIALVRAVYPNGGIYGDVTQPRSLEWWTSYLSKFNGNTMVW